MYTFRATCIKFITRAFRFCPADYDVGIIFGQLHIELEVAVPVPVADPARGVGGVPAERLWRRPARRHATPRTVNRPYALCSANNRGSGDAAPGIGAAPGPPGAPGRAVKRCNERSGRPAGPLDGGPELPLLRQSPPFAVRNLWTEDGDGFSGRRHSLERRRAGLAQAAGVVPLFAICIQRILGEGAIFKDRVTNLHSPLPPSYLLKCYHFDAHAGCG